METKTTSRDYILDAIEMMQNLVALCSHAQEIIHSNNLDFHNEEDSDICTMILEELELRQDILKDAICQRRVVQLKLFEEGQGDHLSWCAFKHAVANHGYAVEVWYANMESDDGPFRYIQMQKAYELMMKVAAIFLGVDELTLCGRCLVDKLRGDGAEVKESGEGFSKEVLKE